MFFVLGLVRSTLLYGLLSLLVCAAAPQLTATTNDEGMLGAVSTLLYLASAAYPLTLAVHPLLARPGYRRRRLPFSYSESLLGALGADFTNPFRGLVALRGAAKTINSKGVYGAYAWGQVYLHVTWAIAFWLCLAGTWLILLTN